METKKTIDEETVKQIEQEETFWKVVLKSLFDIILTLATNSLPFRCNSENLNNDYNGNFLMI